jgi:hypothetical protein
MAAPSQPTFSDLQMYPVISDTEYLPTGEVYMLHDPLDDFSTGYGYQNQDFRTSNAPFNPNLQTSGSTTVTWNRAPVDRWSTCDANIFKGVTNICHAVTPTSLLNTGASRTSPAPKQSSRGSYTPNMVPGCSPMSDISSPVLRELESPRSDSIDHPSDGDFVTEPAPRKRGRPRHSRTYTDPTNNSSSPQRTRRTNCLPHKQVERKYREGLNMEFERLRRAIPTLPQSVDANIIGVAKPSKGMVLGAAIEYIKRVERERDEALDEVQRLGGNVRTTRRRS